MTKFDEGSWVWMPDKEQLVLPAKVLKSFSSGTEGKVRTEDGEGKLHTGGKDRKLTHDDDRVGAECRLFERQFSRIIRCAVVLTLSASSRLGRSQHLRGGFQEAFGLRGSGEGPLFSATEDLHNTPLSSDAIAFQPKLPSSPAIASQCLSSKVDNLITLNNLNENSILHNLRIRFKLDKIYTSVSSILISVNPFKMIPLYTPEVMQSYVNGVRGKDPHIFATGYQAYNNMMTESVNQSVIISGESGAGKSEATKLILQFLSDLSSRSASSHNKSESNVNIEQQILQANPIMEAFGNAKTVRNNNSSRFGKLITVKFKGGSIQGASIINYLLEKSRVVMQSKGERNYHIFYQLLEACECNNKLKSELNLESPDFYAYVNKSGVTSIGGVSDEKEFDELVNAMNSLRFSEDDKLNIWKVIAAILNLGNVVFDVDVHGTSDDGAKIANFDVLDFAAKLIGCSGKALEKALCFRNVGSHSVILVSYSASEASSMRDALAKTLYGELFQWLINKINSAIDHSSPDGSNVIGVLDIFGFECFVSNSFEQMCINYCNEKLQFHFNEHIFRLEQEMYAAEGVTVPATNFVDNQATLDLLEHRSQGIFAMIDEEINVPRGSDKGFLNKANSRHGKHPNFETPKPKACKDAQNCFGIVHYAGTVYYNANNFLEKNKDSLHQDVMSALRASTNDFILEVLPKPPPASASNGRRRVGGKSSKKTLGSQFKEQQQQLMDTLNSTFPHFVRCMKPNKLLQGSVFEEDLMLSQLRYSGLLEVCRIRKLGFPVRRDFDDFFKRYKAIYPSCAGIDALLAKLQEDNKLPSDQFQKGRSKIFMRNAVSQDLEVALEEAFLIHAVQVQCAARGYIMRLKLKSWRLVIANVEVAIASREEGPLTAAIDQCAELPFHGVHLQVVKEARVLQQRLVEEKKVALLLTDALAQRDLDVLLSAVAAANAMRPPLVHNALNNAAKMIGELRAEMTLRAEITAAVNKRDLALIDELLIKAETMGITCDEVNQACALKLRLEEEKEAIKNLRNAIESRDIKPLRIFLTKCAEMGISEPVVAEGRKVEEALLAEASAISALQTGIKERTLQSLEVAVKKAAEIRATDSPEYQAAIDLVEVLHKEKNATEELAGATSARDIPRLIAAISNADALSMRVPELSNAIAMRDTLKKEAACRAELKAATSSGDPASISAALATASSLGVTGVEVEAATKAFGKLSSANEMIGKLLSANVLPEAEIEALIAKAEGMGLSDTTEFAAAKASLAKAKEASILVAKFPATTSFAALSKLLAEADRLGLASRYPSEMAAAQKSLERFALQEKVELALEAAHNGKDLESMIEWLDYASKNDVTSVKIKQGLKNRVSLEKEFALIAKITAAIDSSDIEMLKVLIAEADKKGIKGDKVSQGRVLSDRERLVSDTMAKIAKSVEDCDLSLMNEAFKMAIELGLNGPEIEDAKAKREKLTVLDAASKTLAAVVKTVEVKVFSKGGILEGDAKPLEDSIEEAVSKGLPETHRTMVGARSLVKKMRLQVGVQQQCLDALSSGDKATMKAALKAADDLELQLQSKDEIKIALKEIKDQETMKLQESGGVAEAPDMNDINIEELRLESSKRRLESKNTKYRFWNFSSLRSPNDYAKGTLINKKKVKEGMLKWQETIISKSLLDLGKADSKLAINIHRSILGYMGEKQMSFPATLAHDILTKGLESPVLRDEVYIQLMKQLSHNPKTESAAKGWQLMCMCVSTFPPSEDFAMYLLNFIMGQASGVGTLKNYSTYCLSTLEAMLTSGASGFVPSVEEIQAYKERPPILASVELVSGEVLTDSLSVTPDLPVGKVIEICAQLMDLEDDRVGTLGIFVYEKEGRPDDYEETTDQRKPENPIIQSLPKTPRPLRNEDYLGDVFIQKTRQGKNFKLVFKKKIFMRSSDHHSEDEQYRRLLYLQAEDDVITTGNLIIENCETVAKLSAWSIAYNFMEDDGSDSGFPTTNVEFLENDCMSFIPESWQDAMTEDDWAASILAHRQEAVAMEHWQIENAFVDAIKGDPYYGGHLFFCKKANVKAANDSQDFELPDFIVLCFREDGLHIFDGEMTLFYHFEFVDIVRWGGSSRMFSLEIWVAEADASVEVMLHTAQAPDMAGCILDHINAVMAANGDLEEE